MDEASLTAAGNATFVIPALIVVLVALVNRNRAHTRWGRVATVGAAAAAMAVALRIGQWLLAIILRPEGEAYAPWVFDVRHGVTLAASALFVAGCTMMVYGLARCRNPRFWTACGVAMGAGSAFVGYWLAELVPAL